MSKKKYLINPDHLFIWFSIYLITAIPAYYRIYHTIPIGLIVVLILEEIASYYILDDKMLDMYMKRAKHQSTILVVLVISVLIAITGFIWLFLNEWKLGVIIVGADVLSQSIKRIIDKKKSSRDT
ncbi:MAG: hypothetical protein RR324_06205 [Cellulosilyticaceae bacterium]